MVQRWPDGEKLPRSHHVADHEAVANNNKNNQHREALRLALGSILTPKRPYTPSSRSSSGTASPAHPFSFPSPCIPQVGSPPLSPPVPHPTPVHGGGHTHLLSPHSHPHLHHHSNIHSHTPSRLGIQETHAPDHVSSQSAQGSPIHADTPSPSAVPSQQPSPTPEFQLPPPVVSSSSSPSATESPAIETPPQMASKDSGSASPHSGVGTPKAKFIETLQSKSAWDALIHGSFS